MRIRFFRAWASNNSGAYILLGSFQDASVAEVAARELNEMLVAQDGWGETKPKSEGASPLRVFADQHGLQSRRDEAWWRAGMRCEVLGSQVLLEGFAGDMPSLFGGWVVKHDGHVETEIVLTQKAIVVRAHLSRPSEPRESNEPTFARITERANRDPEVIAALAPRRWSEPGRAVHRRSETLFFAPRDVTRATRAIRAIAAEEGVDLCGFVVSQWVNDHFDPAAIMAAAVDVALYDVLLEDAGETPERVSAALGRTGKPPDSAEWIVSHRPHRRTGVVMPWPRQIGGRLTQDRAEALLALMREAGATATMIPTRPSTRLTPPRSEPEPSA